MNDREFSNLEIEVGSTFEGVITGLQPYGVFVRFGDRSGLCHKSAIPKSIGMGQLKEGMRVTISIISINEDNKISLALIVVIDAKTLSDRAPRKTKAGRVSDGAIVGKNLGYSKEIGKAIKEGVEEINRVGKQYSNNTSPTRTGHVAEPDHVATFNTDAAFQGADAKAVRLGSNGAKSVDIAIKDGSGEVAKKFSSKIYKTANDTADAQRGYGNQERLVPKDQLSGVIDHSNKKVANELVKRKPERNEVAAEYKEVADKATDHLEHDGVKSQSRTREESQKIAEKSKDGDVVGSDIVGDLGTRVKQGAAQGAKSGAMASAALSTFTSSYQAIKDVRKGDKEVTEALRGVAVDVVSSAVDGAVKGAVAGTTTAAARVGVEKVASESMKKVLGGSAPAAVAVAAVEIAKHSIDYARGIKTADQFFDASKGTAISGTASFIGAKIGYEIGGPVGALIGGIAGPWLVDTGRAWFVNKNGSSADLRTGLEQLLQQNALLGNDGNAMLGHDGATAYHMEQMLKMLSALSASDAVIFPDRVLLTDQGHHASAEIVLVYRGKVFVADFKAWKGHLHIPEIIETRTIVDKGFFSNTKRDINVGTGTYDTKKVIQSKIDAYGIRHEKNHRTPVSSLNHFIYHLKNRLVDSDRRWKSVHIEPLAVFPDGEVTLCDRSKESGHFIMFSDFLNLMSISEGSETPKWMLNDLSTTPTWDVLQDSRGNLYQGIIQSPQFTIKLDDGKIDVPFDAILKVEVGKIVGLERSNAAIVTLHDKSTLSGVLESQEIILNRKGHTKSFSTNKLDLVCPAFTFFGAVK